VLVLFIVMCMDLNAVDCVPGFLYVHELQYSIIISIIMEIPVSLSYI
jgi:hypothetical protein